VHILTDAKLLPKNVAGLAHVGTICNKKYSSAINRNYINSYLTSKVIAHELGHNFNCLHDDVFTNRPECAYNDFIMASDFGVNNMDWSRCSENSIKNKINRLKFTGYNCLTNNIHYKLLTNNTVSDTVNPTLFYMIHIILYLIIVYLIIQIFFRCR